MDVEQLRVLGAFATAIAALIVAVISGLYTRSNQKELERLRQEYAEEQAERNARRDYVYEAKKRLYQECCPIIFQLSELAESAYYRIVGLAGAAKRGYLSNSDSSYLSTAYIEQESYFYISTLYRILAPSAALKLL